MRAGFDARLRVVYLDLQQDHTMKGMALFSLAAAGLFSVGCSETSPSSPASQLAIDMASVYSAAPAGFSELSSTYNATGIEGAFMPAFNRGPGGSGFGGPGFGLGLMGGG